jgi:hypothetical protein
MGGSTSFRPSTGKPDLGRTRHTGQLRRGSADPVLRLRAASADLIRLPAVEAEGQVAWTGLSPLATGRRLVSFLVSYMFVCLRPSRSTAGLSAGWIDHHGRSWTVFLHPEKRKVDSSILSLTTSLTSVNACSISRYRPAC